MNKEKSLLHYGVLGMHWGIRRTPEELGHRPRRSAGDRIRSSIANVKEKRRAYTATKASKTVIDVSSMSDEDLNKIVNRLQLEKRYSDLMKELHPKQSSRLKRILVDLADKSVRQIGEKALTKAINNAFTTKEEKDAARAAKELKKVTTEKAIGDAQDAIDRRKFEKDLRVSKISNVREDYTPAQLQSIKSYVDSVSSVEASAAKLSSSEIDRLNTWLKSRDAFNR